MNTYGMDIEKLKTGIPGFDQIAYGGLPKGRTTLIAGTTGSAKTVFGCQFIAEGIIQADEAGVFITFEESPSDIAKNMAGFGWDFNRWQQEEKLAFVDASPTPGEEAVFIGAYDMGALLARIKHAVDTVGASRVVIDSMGTIFTRFTDSSIVRREMLKLADELRGMGVTSLVTCERAEDYGNITRYGVEEFACDNVIVLRHVLKDEKRRRTIEVLKFRGTNHQKGEFPFTVLPHVGIVAIPLPDIALVQESSDERITSGNHSLDEMCDGGFFRDSVTLISGATGTGKTLMVTEFINGGLAHGQKCMLFALEETRGQLFQTSRGWGIGYQQAVDSGQLKVICWCPEAATLEEHLVNMMTEIREFQPDRIAVDSLSSLERMSTVKGFREFVIGLTSFTKGLQIAGLFTAVTPTFMGGTSETEAQIYTITDSIILLRYVELFGEMRRGLTVIKMRGSDHDKEIREFTIDGHGMHIGKPFRNVIGIIAGQPRYVSPDEVERMDEMFKTL